MGSLLITEYVSVSLSILSILFKYSVLSNATVIFPLSALVKMMLGLFLTNLLVIFIKSIIWVSMWSLYNGLVYIERLDHYLYDKCPCLIHTLNKDTYCISSGLNVQCELGQ